MEVQRTTFRDISRIDHVIRTISQSGETWLKLYFIGDKILCARLVTLAHDITFRSNGLYSLGQVPTLLLDMVNLKHLTLHIANVRALIHITTNGQTECFTFWTVFHQIVPQLESLDLHLCIDMSLSTTLITMQRLNIGAMRAWGDSIAQHNVYEDYLDVFQCLVDACNPKKMKSLQVWFTGFYHTPMIQTSAVTDRSRIFTLFRRIGRLYNLQTLTAQFLHSNDTQDNSVSYHLLHEDVEWLPDSLQFYHMPNFLLPVRSDAEQSDMVKYELSSQATVRLDVDDFWHEIDQLSPSLATHMHTLVLDITPAPFSYSLNSILRIIPTTLIELEISAYLRMQGVPDHMVGMSLNNPSICDAWPAHLQTLALKQFAIHPEALANILPLPDACPNLTALNLDVNYIDETDDQNVALARCDALAEKVGAYEKLIKLKVKFDGESYLWQHVLRQLPPTLTSFALQYVAPVSEHEGLFETVVQLYHTLKDSLTHLDLWVGHECASSYYWMMQLPVLYKLESLSYRVLQNIDPPPMLMHVGRISSNMFPSSLKNMELNHVSLHVVASGWSCAELEAFTFSSSHLTYDVSELINSLPDSVTRLEFKGQCVIYTDSVHHFPPALRAFRGRVQRSITHPINDMPHHLPNTLTRLQLAPQYENLFYHVVRFRIPKLLYTLRVSLELKNYFYFALTHPNLKVDGLLKPVYDGIPNLRPWLYFTIAGIAQGVYSSRSTINARRTFIAYISRPRLALRVMKPLVLVAATLALLFGAMPRISKRIGSSTTKMPILTTYMSGAVMTAGLLYAGFGAVKRLVNASVEAFVKW